MTYCIVKQDNHHRPSLSCADGYIDAIQVKVSQMVSESMLKKYELMLESIFFIASAIDGLTSKTNSAKNIINKNLG